MEAAPTTTEIQVVRSSEKAQKAGKRVSNRKADEALRDLGLLSVSSKNLRGYSIIGRFLDENGIVDYGNGRLVGTAVVMETALRACSDVILNAGNDHDLKAKFIELQLRIAKAIDANVALVSRDQAGQQSKKPSTEQPTKPFAVGSIVVPIQINQVSTSEKSV